MRIIDDMITKVEHHDSCSEPQYSAHMYYDRCGNGLINFGCMTCHSYDNYQCNKSLLFDIFDERSKSVKFKQLRLLTKDQLEFRSAHAQSLMS